MVQVWWLCWWAQGLMEWTGGILVSIRAELDKEKMGEDLEAAVCVCVWGGGGGGGGGMCVGGCGFATLLVIHFTQTHSHCVFPL